MIIHFIFMFDNSIKINQKMQVILIFIVYSNDCETIYWNDVFILIYYVDLIFQIV